jgi:hypothetical protein
MKRSRFTNCLRPYTRILLDVPELILAVSQRSVDVVEVDQHRFITTNPYEVTFESAQLVVLIDDFYTTNKFLHNNSLKKRQAKTEGLVGLQFDFLFGGQ